MSEYKLEKVNERLYHRLDKEGRPLKWEKKLRFVHLALREIRPELCLDIKRPETAIRFFEGMAQTDANSMTTANKELGEKYSQSLDWRITAKGDLDRDTIGLIKVDGSLTSHTEDFTSTDVFLRPVPDTEKEEACGWLLHSDAEFESREEPYLSMTLFVPETAFKKVCEELVAGRLTTLSLGAHIDIFQSEMDSLLGSSGMKATYYIEAESLWNKVYLSWLTCSKEPFPGRSGLPANEA